MVINVGINGFGRVGRVIFRTCLQTSDIEITAINDPAIEVDYISYLIKYDSTHGRLPGNISHADDEIKIDDQRIKVFRQKYPVCIPWSQAGVQYVIEASGMFTSMEKAVGHLGSDSVKRVIITAPSVDVPMIIIGVNDSRIDIEQRVISCGSSTLYCLAPIIKILEQHYGVEAGFITSIHAMTPSLKPLDGLCLRGKHWRDHRSILQNIIPATTGACKALGKIIPQVRDKLSGLAFRVPIVNVSVLDLTIRLLKPTTTEEIVRNIEKASKTTMKNIITVCNEETVSSDFMNETHSCVVDAESSLQLETNFFKIICWYENEYSYACRVVDLIHLSEKQFEKTEAIRWAQLKTKISMRQDIVLQTKDNLIKKESSYVLEPESKQTGKKSIKPPPRPVLLKKPMILHHNSPSPSINAGEPNKNKVELFKIWNDEKIINNSNDVRQNRGSFFHACNKPSNCEGGNAQERLEKVKEEFSKMVSITELLLNKSYSNKLSLKPPKENLDLVKTKTDTVESVPQKNNRKFIKLDMSGDGRMSDCTVHLGCSKETVQHVYDKNTSDLSMVETINSSHSKNKNYPIPEKVLPIHEDAVAKGDAESTTPKKSTQSTSKLPDPSMIAFKSQMSETFSNIIKRFHVQPSETNLRITHKENTNKKTTNGSKRTTKVAFNTPLQVFDATSGSGVNIKKNTAMCEDAISEYHQNTNGSTTDRKSTTETEKKHLEDAKKHQETKNLFDNMKKLMSVDRIDVELKRRNIVLMDEENSSADSQKVACKQDSTQLDDGFQEEVKVKEEQENLQTSVPSTSFVTHTYAMKRPIVVKKQDIYDKLDSPTGTDSENSLNTKKSQVIHITDLTNSLDDLERLDKICRIIEISDELSDQLFSPLDNYKDEGRTKRWSFKDLCDRICLDEFCDHVFGK